MLPVASNLCPAWLEALIPRREETFIRNHSKSSQLGFETTTWRLRFSGFLCEWRSLSFLWLRESILTTKRKVIIRTEASCCWDILWGHLDSSVLVCKSQCTWQLKLGRAIEDPGPSEMQGYATFLVKNPGQIKSCLRTRKHGMVEWKK